VKAQLNAEAWLKAANRPADTLGRQTKYLLIGESPIRNKTTNGFRIIVRSNDISRIAHGDAGQQFALTPT
jgi:hypothetical protein